MAKLNEKISEFLSPESKERYKKEAAKAISDLRKQLGQIAPILLQMTSTGEALFHSHQMVKRSRAGVRQLREGDLRGSAGHAAEALMHAVALYRKGQFRSALKWSKLAQKAWNLALERELSARTKKRKRAQGR